ncbi:MAG: phenylalanine--tRNA ligase subunit beta [Bacteroidetes bacterium]|nr:MAG: phenylalanine--tRNA ligase subunit beta [Bacteroidota bacterium]
MKISYNWLKNYVNTDLPVERVAEILTDTGLEVEGVEKIEALKGGLDGVVIGEVLTCEKHPDADRLNVTTVNVGNGEPLQIVCGAPNVAAGQKVVVATVGCTLYPSPEEPFKIKKSKIRGVESEGMICAEDELGIGNSHDGIMVLSEDAKVGSPASSFFDLEDDFLIEIGLTPNRADAMGHVGVARDLIAYLNIHDNKKLNLIWPSIDQFKVERYDLPIKVLVKDHAACPRYTGVSIKGVAIKSSPEWLQKRLRTIGLTPINNVVDVTNFVMHELGNPLHAFDADKLGGKIVVQRAKKGTKFITLDGEEREMKGEELMITNGKEDLCIAGVFGGLDSGISDQTVNVFLESAYFDPVVVRKTAKLHGLSTDSSFRFERGVDPDRTLFALKRAAILIKEIAGGEVGMEIEDTNPEFEVDRKIQFNYERCRKLIGANIPDEEITAILEVLGFRIAQKNGDTLFLEVPAFRVDVNREADVIEEVLRIYGYNKVPLPEKLNSSINKFPKPDPEKVQQVVSDMLAGMGFLEMMNNSLTKPVYVDELGGEALKSEHHVSILNPLSQDLAVMRQSLVFGALEVVAYNQNRQNPDLRLFEFGKIYRKFESGYNENRRLVTCISGKSGIDNWTGANDAFTYYSIKSYLRRITDRLGLSEHLTQKALKNSIFEDGVQLYILKTKIGEMGWIGKKTKKHFGIKNHVYLIDLDWDAIIDSLKLTSVKYKELPKTFAVRRDFSLMLDKSTRFEEIEEIARNIDKKLLQEVGLFDVYEGDKLEEGKKSYAVSFHFQDAEKTLKDEQIDAIMSKIRAELESKLNAQLR